MISQVELDKYMNTFIYSDYLYRDPANFGGDGSERND